MIELIVFKAKASTPEELEMVRQALNGLFGDVNSEAESIVKTTEIQKQKKSDYDKKRYQDKKNFTVSTVEKVKNAESAKEEREEEKEKKEQGSPLSSPLPFSPNTPYPIPPIIPPSQEKKEREGEREESFLANESNSGETHISRVTVPYGKYVRLTGAEYTKLVRTFGPEETDAMIQRMNDYIGEDPKRVKKYESRNHYLTLLNWDRMNKERKVQHSQQKPQQKSWLEVAREIEAEEKGEVVDL